MFGRAIVIGGLLLLLTAIAPASVLAGGGGHGRCGEVEREVVRAVTEVLMVTSCFEAAVVEVAVGTTVAWRNVDGYGHAIDGVGAEWGAQGGVPAGGSFAQRFDEPGVYPYYCVLHPSMVGAVVVTEGSSRDGSPLEAASTGSFPLLWLFAGLVGSAVATGSTAFARSRR